MTLTTTPDNLRYPTGPATVGRIQTWLKNLADDVQLALNSLTNQHAEFTVTTAISGGAYAPVGVFTRDATNSTSSTLVTPGASGVLTLNSPGVYAVTARFTTDSAIASSNDWIVDLRGQLDNADTSILIAANGVNFNSNAYLSLGNMRVLSPGQVVRANVLMSSGVNRTITTRLRITKLGRV